MVENLASYSSLIFENWIIGLRKLGYGGRTDKGFERESQNN